MGPTGGKGDIVGAGRASKTRMKGPAEDEGGALSYACFLYEAITEENKKEEGQLV